MKKVLITLAMITFLVGQASTGSIETLESCNSMTGSEPLFILDSAEDSHILNFSSSYYSESHENRVVCLDQNFTATVDDAGSILGGYEEAFSVTEYFTDPEYGSHVRVPPTSEGRSVYLKYRGLRAVDDVGVDTCDPESSDCRFLFSVNDTESDHGSHIGERDSGENVQIALRTGFRVNIRSISQYDDDRHRIKMNVSADTGTDSVGIFERTIDWNVSDDIDEFEDVTGEGRFESKTWAETPRNVTETLEGPTTYPDTGEYDVEVSLRYALEDGRFKYKNRTVSLPKGTVSWDRTLEIENPDERWVVMGPTEEIPTDEWSECGIFLGYSGDGDGLETMLRNEMEDPLPAKPMLGTFTRSCDINYNHATSPNKIKFGTSTSEDKGGWNITRLSEPLNFTQFYEGDTDCGILLGYGIKDGGLETYLVQTESSDIVYEEKLPEKSMISTTNDCTVTTS